MPVIATVLAFEFHLECSFDELFASNFHEINHMCLRILIIKGKSCRMLFHYNSELKKQAKTSQVEVSNEFMNDGKNGS